MRYFTLLIISLLREEYRCVDALAYNDARSIPSSLSRLLLQRAVQTQVMYLTDFHDELRSEWLSGFGSPCAPLEVERVSNRESLPRYHGLDAFTEWHESNYLESMFKAAPQIFHVRYRVGRPDMMPGTVTENAELADEAMQMWGALPGSATRRRNPYLESSVRWIEYNDTIVPMRCAELILRTRQQLAHEWAKDLRSLPKVFQADDYEKLTRNAPIEAVSTFEDHVSSPLRGANFDLCDRLVTRHAANDFLKELQQDGASAAADLLANHLQLVADSSSLSSSEENHQITADADAANDNNLSESLDAAVCRLVSVDALGGHARSRGLALRWLDRLPDQALADEIRSRRISIGRSWASHIVDTTHEHHQSLLRNNLESQLYASMPEEEA